MSAENCHLCCEPVHSDEAFWTDDPESDGRLPWCPDLGPCLGRALDRLRRAQRRPLRVTGTLGGRERQPV